MKISKRQLKRIIREEKRRLRENCSVEPIEAHPEPHPEPAEAPIAVVAESEAPVTDMLVEMEVASRSLELVVESVQNAAHLCHDCGAGVADKAPVVEAMVAQAEALKEMLDAQTEVLQESADVTVSDTPIIDAVLSTLG